MICQHCETREAKELLCETCNSKRYIQALYTRVGKEPPELTERIMQMRRRAEQHKDLFEGMPPLDCKKRNAHTFSTRIRNEQATAERGTRASLTTGTQSDHDANKEAA